MTIDERLDRLTERQEALTQIVHLLTAELQTTVKLVEKLAKVALLETQPPKT